MFGDYDPEDAWDADDPDDVKIANLQLRADVLEELDDRRAVRVALALVDIDTLARRHFPRDPRLIALRRRFEALE